MKPLQGRKKLLCLDLSYFVWFNDFPQKYDDYMYFSVKPMALVISILFIKNCLYQCLKRGQTKVILRTAVLNCRRTPRKNFTEQASTSHKKTPHSVEPNDTVCPDNGLLTTFYNFKLLAEL